MVRAGKRWFAWMVAACCAAVSAIAQAASGDVEEETEEVADAESAFVGVGGFSAAYFPFVTIVPDDGAGSAGGWQSAMAVLNFVDRQIYPYEPEYRETVEARRLAERRQQAVADYPAWCGFLARLSHRLPDCGIAKKVMYLAKLPQGACYAADLCLPTLPKDVGGHVLCFQVSFLGPYYVLHSSRFLWRDEKDSFGYRLSGPGEERFDLTPEERPYADRLVPEIEAEFPGYELMPPEMGHVVIPDLQHEGRAPGEATIYDCLIDDQWIPRKKDA